MGGSENGESLERKGKKPAGGVNPHPRAWKIAGSPNMPDVDGDRALSPDPLDLAILQHPKETYLRGR